MNEFLVVFGAVALLFVLVAACVAIQIKEDEE